MQAGELNKLLPGAGGTPMRNRDVAAQERPHNDPFKWRIPPRLALVILGCLLVGCSLLSFATLPQYHAAMNASTKVTENQELDPQEGNLSHQENDHHAIGGSHDEGRNTRMGEEVESEQSESSSSIETDTPNVIFIMVDDMGMNDIGLQSSDLGEMTPFIDSLINDGVHLSRYYTNHICTPARVRFIMEQDA